MTWRCVSCLLSCCGHASFIVRMCCLAPAGAACVVSLSWIAGCAGRDSIRVCYFVRLRALKRTQLANNIIPFHALPLASTLL